MNARSCGIRSMLGALSLLVAVAASAAPGARAATISDGRVDQQAFPDPLELAAAHVEAIGGRSSVEGVRGYRSRGTAEMPAQNIRATVQEWIQPGEGWRERWDIEGFGRVELGFEGGLAWTVRPGQPPDAVREEKIREGFASLVVLHPEADVSAHLGSARTVGRREIAGRSTWEVQVTTPAGAVHSRFYDAETGRLRAVEREDLLTGEPARILTVYEDWRPVDGVLFPYRLTRTWANGPELVSVLESVTTEPVPPGAVRPPAEAVAAASEDRSEVDVERDVMLPMRDGVRLATDIYRPLGAADRLPVILIRLPYNKTRYGGATVPARLFAERGYVVVVQDSRGKWGSEGEYVVSQSARNDGYDTVEWAASQPWSNGRVGTYGCSYLGENQVMLAAERHPAHVAMIPQAAGGAVGTAGGRYGFFGFFEGGAFSLSAGVGWFPMSGTKDGTDRQVQIPVPEGLHHLPTIDIMRHHGVGPTDWEDVLTKPLDDPWWQSLGYIADSDSFATPALHVNSWYDLGAAETLQLFNLMRRNAVGEHTREHQYVIISPTTHCDSERATENTRVGDLDVGDARFPYWETYLRWFDHWLKDADNGITRMPRVQYYVTGASEWRSADEWPVPEARPTRFHLRSGGAAGERMDDGVLSRQSPAANEPPDRYVYDPADPVPSRGGSVCCTGNPQDQPGAYDQSDLEERDDVLVYTTPPLEDPLDIVGPLRATLYVSSSAPDTDFTVKLVDVHPDGRAFNVQEGITRARYREGFDRTVLMRSGEVYEVEVDLHATAHRFRAGHRVRVEVSSSNFPRFDRNLNTGGDNFTETDWRIAENAIHHSREHPSHLLLPVVSVEHEARAVGGDTVRVAPLDSAEALFTHAVPEEVGLSTESLTELADLVRGWTRDTVIVGAEILVVKDGRAVLHEAMGWSHLEAGEPMQKNSIFRLLALTKPFTGTAGLMLVEEGKLDLDAPVSRWLPSWANEHSGEVKVRQLLTHTSGWEQYGTPRPLESYASLRDMVDDAGEHGPQHPPGEAYRYSDVNSYALGALVAEVSGVPVERFIEERILGPLGLDDTHTRFAPDTAWARRVNSRYQLEDGAWKKVWSPEQPQADPFFRASGGLFSTAMDYARWLEAWMEWMSAPLDTTKAEARTSEAAYPEVPRLVSSRMARAAVTPADGPYGFHWEILSDDPLVFGHGGVDGTHAMAIPSRDLIVIYLSQSQGREMRGKWTAAALQAVAPGLDLRRPLASVPAERSGLDVVELTPDQQARYAGRYRAGSFTVRIFEEGGRLQRRLPTTGAPAVTLVPLGDHTFAMGRHEGDRLTDVVLPLQRLRFVVEDGRATALELVRDDEVRVVLQRLTPAAGPKDEAVGSDTVHVAPPTSQLEADRASILAALDVVEPDGTVQFGPGTYLIGEAITVAVPEVTLLGHPDGTTLRDCDPSAFEDEDFAVAECNGFNLIGEGQAVRDLGVASRDPFPGYTLFPEPPKWEAANGSGIWISPGSDENEIVGNSFTDVAAYAVVLEGDRNRVETESAGDSVRDLGSRNRLVGDVNETPGDPDAARLAQEVTIYRDAFGVPHVHGRTDEAAIFGLAYARAEDQFELIEQIFINRLGRASEIHGEDGLLSPDLARGRDLLVHAYRYPEEARDAWDRLPAELRGLIEAYTAGLNYYLEKHPDQEVRLLDRFEPWWVLAVEDASESYQGMVHSGAFGADPSAVMRGAWRGSEQGSNAWAIGPARTASGNSMLFVNPHDPSRFPYYECHIMSDEGLNSYGVLNYWGALMLPYIGFNENLGWSVTINEPDLGDAFRMTFDHPTDLSKYRFGDEYRIATSWETEIRLTGEGGVVTRTIPFTRTLHGPVLATSKDGEPISFRIARSPSGTLTEQLYRMHKARNLEEWKEAVALRGITYHNLMYADGAGNIFYLYNGNVPVRDDAFDWTQSVEGSDPRVLWQGYHEIDELPQLLNPGAGYLQNANSSPFVTTHADNPDPADYPRYMTNLDDEDTYRAQRSRQLLRATSSITLDDLQRMATDTYLYAADEWLPLLFAEWDSPGQGDASLRDRLQEPIAALKKWNRESNAESIETTLFVLWDEAYRLKEREGQRLPLLSSLVEAVDILEREFGTWEVAWKDVFRHQRRADGGAVYWDEGRPSHPTSANHGRYGVMFNMRGESYDGARESVKRRMKYGNSFVSIVEFTPDGPVARSIVAYGNSTDPNSPHYEDQAAMFARGGMKPVLFDMEDILANLEERYRPGERKP